MAVVIGFMAGAPTQRSVPFAVASLSGAVIRATCNGRTVRIKPKSANPVWLGHGTFTGLTAGQRYTVTLTQGSTTETVSVCTAPRPNQAFRLYFGSCDNWGSLGGVAGGIWTRYRTYLETGAIAYCLFVDDWGYISAMTATDTTTGHATSATPATSLNDRDFNICYAVAFGLYTNTANTAINWGSNADRLYCHRNMPFLMQWGDWEFSNDIGFDAEKARESANYQPGKSAWDRWIGPLMPSFSIRNRDTLARPWRHELGGVSIVAPDGITRSETTMERNYPGLLMDAMLGEDQIEDCLDALNTPHPIKLLGMMHGDRYMCPFADAIGPIAGWQHPIFDMCLPEYQRLYTASGQSPKSICDNPETNGTTGKLIALHGDTHRAMHTRNRATSYSGNLAETWDSWCIGTVNGSTNFRVQDEAQPYVITGGTYGGTTIVWTQNSGDFSSPLGNYYHGLYGDFDGASTMTMSLINSSGTVVRSEAY